AAGQLAAGEGPQRPVEVGLAEAEAVDGRERAGAPAVAAGVLEAGLRAGVAVEDRRVVGALGHLRLEAGELLLERDEVLAAAEDVVAEGDVALTRRALVVEADARALLEHQLAAV